LLCSRGAFWKPLRLMIMTGPIQAEVVGPVTIVSFRDCVLVTPDRVEAIREALDRLVEEGHRNLLFDLGGVEYLESRMLGVLLMLKRRIVAALPPERRVPPPAQAPIQLDVGPGVRMPQRSRIFEVYPDRESALRVLSEAGPGHGWIALCNARPEIRDFFRVC
jgi:hypothetical protein